MIPFSILDLAPVVEGGDVRQSLASSVALAQAGERLGYNRFWLAEHHGMQGIASAATSVVIGHVAGGTERIRVGLRAPAEKVGRDVTYTHANASFF